MGTAASAASIVTPGQDASATLKAAVKFRNFYNDAFTRLGYGDQVAVVAELWQAGKRDEARAAVPIDLGRLTNLVGTRAGITERVGMYRAAGITTLLTKVEGDYSDQLATLAQLLDVVSAF